MSADGEHEQLSLEAVEPLVEAEAAPEAEVAPATEVAPAIAPTAQQQAAIDNRDRDVFLEAGAGTGKTRVLVERYCEAVDTDGVEPERILAFTFTEKAAAEMRRRVRVELGARATASQDPAQKARLQEAARAGEAAPITTIHGFCRRLLASHPVAAGLDPRFRVLDADEAARIARGAFDDALAALAGSDDEVALTAAGYRNRLGSIVMAAHSDLRNRGELNPLLPDLHFERVEGSDEPATPAERAAITAGYEALRKLTTAFGECFEARKADRSAVDFDDLQLLALALMLENETIAAAQRDRFDHLLVDEFQDTSPIQVELVRALAGPETHTFTVGDAAQSIYAFRGADLASFRRERERIASGAAGKNTAMLGLTGSFRSTPDVVAAVNVVGSTLLDDYRPLSVGRPPDGTAEGEPAIELLLTQAKGWGEEDEGTLIKTVATDTPQNRIAEARGLARRLRELAQEGVEPGSMVVLLRAFTHVDAYAEALELAGLDPYVVGGRGYWSSQQVTDAIGLLSCVANPLSDEPLLGALASPACAVSPDGLWILRRIAGSRHLWRAIEQLAAPREDGDPDGEPQPEAEPDPELEKRIAEQRLWEERLPPADRERLVAFHDTLVGIRSTAALLPLDDLVERVLEGFGYDLAALLMDDGLRRTANLLKLVRIAGEYEAHEGRDLRGFLEQAATRAAMSDREAEAAVAAEDHAGVRVMTVHAAKGLEFDCVAVADLGRKLAGGGQPPQLRFAFDEGEPGEAPAPRIGLRLARAGASSIDVAGYKQINDEAADADAEESGRLAYVAASRARKRLLLSGTFDPEKDVVASDKPRRQLSAIGCLLPVLGVDGEDGQIVTAPAPEALEGIDATRFAPARIRVGVTGPGRDQVERLSADDRGRRVEAGTGGGTPPMLALAERGTAASRSLSYAALAGYRRCGYRFLAERVLQLGRDGQATVAGPDGPAPSKPGGMGFGRAVHELLEWSARNGWDEPPSPLVEATMRREGFDKAAAGRASGLVAGWLGSEFATELRSGAATFRPEVPFRIRIDEITVIRGTIDLLVTGAGRPPTFVDYKTDSIPDDGVPVLPPAYEMQRVLYSAAIAEATRSSEVGSAYCFLQAPTAPILRTMDEAEIAAGMAGVGELVGRIREGDFEPTSDPGPSLCHDCPARARLCPYPPEVTLGKAG